MKRILLLLSIVLFIVQNNHAQCDLYERMISEADSLLKLKTDDRYEKALNLYNAARRCDPTQSNTIDSMVIKTFHSIKEDLKTLKSQKEKLERQSGTLKEQKTRLENLSNQINYKEKELEHKQIELNGLLDSLSREQVHLNSLKIEFDKKEKELNTAKKDLDGLKKDLSEKEENIKQAQINLDALENDLIIKETQLNTAIEQLDEEQKQKLIAYERNEKLVAAFYFYKDRLALAYGEREFGVKKFGFINKSGDVIIDYKYEKAEQFDELTGFAKVSKSGNNYLLDIQGKEYPVAYHIDELKSNTLALDLRGENTFKDFPKEIFEHPQLEIIFLDNVIKNIKKPISINDNIQKFKDLKFLSLKNCDVNNISNKIYGLKKLEWLDLEKTNISHLSENIQKLDSLFYLNIAQTKINRADYEKLEPLLPSNHKYSYAYEKGSMPYLKKGDKGADFDKLKFYLSHLDNDININKIKKYNGKIVKLIREHIVNPLGLKYETGETIDEEIWAAIYEQVYSDTFFTKGIVNHLLEEEEYYTKRYPKTSIYLHHTAGNHNPKSTIKWWNEDNYPDGNAKHVATAFLIGRKASRDSLYEEEYDGVIYRTFNESMWAHHVGINYDIDKSSIGISLCSYGALNKDEIGYYYPIGNKKIYIRNEDVCILDEPWRGKKYFEKYTDKQIKELERLILTLAYLYNIEIEDIKYDREWFDINQEALEGAPGIWTYANLKQNKTSCFPQTELIDMLNGLYEKQKTFTIELK